MYSKRCNICHGTSGWGFPEDITGSHTVTMCDNCGLIRTDSGLLPVAIDEFYEKGFKSDPGAANSPSDLSDLEQVDFLDSKQVLKTMVMPLLSPYIDIRGKRCLEIRFRTGAWLELLSDMGASYTAGVDIFKNNVDSVQLRVPGAVLTQCSVYDLPGLAEGKFDLISGASIHVLSHIPDIRLFISRICDLLADDGIIFFDEKDISMITTGAKTLPLCHPNPIAHYFHFTLETVRSALENCGLEIMFCEIYQRESDLAHIAIVGKKAKNTKIRNGKKFVSNKNRDDLKSQFEFIVRDHQKRMHSVDRAH